MKYITIVVFSDFVEIQCLEPNVTKPKYVSIAIQPNDAMPIINEYKNKIDTMNDIHLQILNNTQFK